MRTARRQPHGQPGSTHISGQLWIQQSDAYAWWALVPFTHVLKRVSLPASAFVGGGICAGCLGQPPFPLGLRLFAYRLAATGGDHL